jgi:hypothetical protein
MKLINKLTFATWQSIITDLETLSHQRKTYQQPLSYHMVRYYVHTGTQWSQCFMRSEKHNRGWGPTIKELRKVVYTLGLKIGLSSQNQRGRTGYIPDPQKLGWLKYDREEYIKILQLEARKCQN